MTDRQTEGHDEDSISQASKWRCQRRHCWRLIEALYHGIQHQLYNEMEPK